MKIKFYKWPLIPLTDLWLGVRAICVLKCTKCIRYIKLSRASSISTDKFGHGKVEGVPNKKSKIDYYSIHCDCAIKDESICHYSTQIPNTQSLKKLLKEVIARADEKNYRFVGRREDNHILGI